MNERHLGNPLSLSLALFLSVALLGALSAAQFF